MASFSSIAFQSALTFEAIILGVFGFLYSVFASYFVSYDLEKGPLAPIVGKLRMVLRLLSLWILLSAGIAVWSLIIMWPNQLQERIIAILLLVMALTAPLFSLWWSFFTTE